MSVSSGPESGSYFSHGERGLVGQARGGRHSSAGGDRLHTLKRLLNHAYDRLGLTCGFRLWDGSEVPSELPHGTPTLAIADEGVIAALLRRPTLDTLANLWVSGRIDVLDGTVFDLLAALSKLSRAQILSRLDKGLLLTVVAKFLTVRRGGPWPLAEIHGERGLSDGSEAANKRNIAYHYDVSNAFYALFLDPEMVYTCGYFRDRDNDLATAQHDKLDMICRKLRLEEGEAFLDIGCGWGALICHAAQHHGVRAHGVTLSSEQLAFARAKVARLGLQDRVSVELRDYATLDGPFDKIASVGMFEHVGLANHDRYFTAVSRLLKPGGLYLHHAIVRPAERNARRFKRKSPQYKALIRYIFPGGELDHIGMSTANLEAHGFEVHDVEGWREHYQLTCRHWHDRLHANRAAAEREVGPVKTRLWLAFLAGCSLAFEHNTARIFQTLVSKAKVGASGLPMTRDDLYIRP